MIVVVAVLGFLLSWWFCRLLSRPGSWLYLLDTPNHRSLHSQPTPRGGGLGIMAGLALGWGVLVWLYPAPKGFPVLVGAVALLAIVSYLDDRRGLTQGVRLVVHLMAAGMLALLFPISVVEVPGVGALLLPPVVALGFTVGLTVWLTNLYNFMDGMDGFAAGMGVCGFGFLALFGWRGEEPFFAMTAVLLAMANLGFLLENFPPARIFMGDVGAIPMGFLVAVMTAWGCTDGLFPLWTPVLIFSPFVVDASVTLLRRLANRERIFEAHRSHYYQRLAGLGWPHRRVVLVEYGVMLAAGGSAWLLSVGGGSRRVVLGLLLWGLFYLLAALWIGRLEKRLSKPMR